eukprot:TRINITY_DN67058_c8_g3_i2.p1 TRINITY_DN67058_c8_g3~~TRINITY_DN67058_c8_g3_i2.p1  ORF type:complete len:185 (+),score=17.88 TRINITY_DN67058_c8_g3_i2:114-668(+)
MGFLPGKFTRWMRGNHHTPRDKLLSGLSENNHMLWPWQMGVACGMEQPVAAEMFLHARDVWFMNLIDYNLNTLNNNFALRRSRDVQVWIRYKVKLPVFRPFQLVTRLVALEFDVERDRTLLFFEQKMQIKGVTHTQCFAKVMVPHNFSGSKLFPSPPLETPEAIKLWKAAEVASSEGMKKNVVG